MALRCASSSDSAWSAICVSIAWRGHSFRYVFGAHNSWCLQAAGPEVLRGKNVLTEVLSPIRMCGLERINSGDACRRGQLNSEQGQESEFLQKNLGYLFFY